MLIGPDPRRIETLLQLLPPFRADGEDMPDRNGIFRDMGQDELRILDLGKIAPGRPPAVLIDLRKKGELRIQKGSLQLIETGITALTDMMILIIRAVISELTHLPRDLRIVCHDRPRIPERAQVLPGIEAKARGDPEGADHPPLIERAVRLRAVLHHIEASPLCDFHDLIHLAGLSVEMHRDQSAGPSRNFLLDPLRVNVKGPDIRLHKYGKRSGIGHSERRRDIGIGRHDDLIPRADPERLQDENERVQSVSDSDAIFHPAVLREVLLKFLVLLALDIPGSFVNSLKGRPDLAVELPLEGFKADKRHSHLFSSPSSPTKRRNSS